VRINRLRGKALIEENGSSGEDAPAFSKNDVPKSKSITPHASLLK
jgi:hypothetical protein